MAYNFNLFKTRIGEIKEWLTKEYSSVRTGKASPLLLDNIMVESYGSRTPIKHVASISTEDAKTLRVTPWDKAQIKAIETAIAQANLGISTAPDQTGLRIIFPDLTEDRRKSLMKIVNEKLEEAKVTLRKEREKVWNEIQAQEKSGGISEDDKFKLKDDLQKIIDDTNSELETIAGRKETEIFS